MDPLIVTSRLDARAAAELDALRRRHFPPERNHLSAHLTLFHKLPGEEEAAVRADLGAVAARQDVIPARAERVLPLGRGTAIAIAAPPLLAVRDELARRWAAWLTAQDRQRPRLHVTIQNKVAPEVARALQRELPFVPFETWIEGLELWRYRGGPWEPVATVPFAGGST